MGYKRKRWESVHARKREKNELRTQQKNVSRKRIKSSAYLPSERADNRFVCPRSGRMKYGYDTIEKALKACQYAPNPQRPYYCKSCRRYHTTSETKAEYYSRSDEAFRKRTGRQPLHTALPDLVEHPDMVLPTR